jgi:hypothetical protein
MMAAKHSSPINIYTLWTKSHKKRTKVWAAGADCHLSKAAAYFDRCMLHIRCRLRPSCEVCAQIVTAKEQANALATATVERSAKRQKVDNYFKV